MTADVDTPVFDQLSSSEIEEIQKELESGGKDAYRRLMERKLDDWKNVPLNVAVIGNSGVGKSSFINAIRRLTADDKGAAAVGVTQTTTDIQGYPHPRNPNLKFWDLPGVGTDDYSKEEYLDKIKVDSYDYFLLTSATRFTANDTWLGQEIKKRSRKFAFVRNKVGVDISGNAMAHPESHDEPAVVDQIRQDTEKHLKAHGNEDAPIFLIDSYETHKFDFDRLQQDLAEDTEKAKQSAMTLSMCSCTRKLIRLKVEELRSRIWKVASASAGVALVPVPGLSLEFDIAIVLREAKFYFEQFDLDSVSLRRNAKTMKVDYGHLKAMVDGEVGPEFLTHQGIMRLAQTLPKPKIVKTSMAAKEFIYLIPVIGPLIAAPMSFGGTYGILYHILKLLERVALNVVTYASKHCRIDKNDDNRPKHQ